MVRSQENHLSKENQKVKKRLSWNLAKSEKKLLKSGNFTNSDAIKN